MKKGRFDVRIVYNRTGCGLHDSVWARHSGLPTVHQTLRSLLPCYSQCALDIGGMFLNFLLNNSMKEMSGVDVQHVRSKKEVGVDWDEKKRPQDFERWCRNWIGLRDSPYWLIQLLIQLKIEVYGNQWDCSNPFHLHWERVIYNFPGTRGYHLGLPWVMKVCFDGHLACEVYVYVDDVRVTGHSREL